MGFIYRIRNETNGLSYIGKTQKDWAAERLLEWHRENAADKNSIYRDIPVNKAIRLGGPFSADLLEECADAALERRQVYWISKLNTCAKGYNYPLINKQGYLKNENFLGKICKKGRNDEKIKMYSSLDEMVRELGISKREGMAAILQKKAYGGCTFELEDEPAALFGEN